MKIIEELYKRYIQSNKPNMQYKYLDYYFQDVTTDKFCFLELRAYIEEMSLINISISMLGNTNKTYSAQGGISVDEIKKLKDAAPLTKVYVHTDFDTKEKALSGAKAAEKGLK